MITNLVVLSLSLLTNSQQAIVGESQGKTLVASQETVIQRRILLEDVVLSNSVTTNAVGFAFRTPTNNQPLPTDALHNPARSAPLNTNSPAYRRRLEREQRMKATTNAPPQQTK